MWGRRRLVQPGDCGAGTETQQTPSSRWRVWSMTFSTTITMSLRARAGWGCASMLVSQSLSERSSLSIDVFSSSHTALTSSLMSCLRLSVLRSQRLQVVLAALRGAFFLTFSGYAIELIIVLDLLPFISRLVDWHTFLDYKGRAGWYWRSYPQQCPIQRYQHNYHTVVGNIVGAPIGS